MFPKLSWGVSSSFDFSRCPQRRSIQVDTSLVLTNWYVSKNRQLAHVLQLTLPGRLQFLAFRASKHSKNLCEAGTICVFFSYLLCFSLKSTQVH